MDKQQKPERPGRSSSIAGTVLTVLGGILFAVGLISVFMSFITNTMPVLFIFCFIGIILLGIGRKLRLRGKTAGQSRTLTVISSAPAEDEQPAEHTTVSSARQGILCPHCGMRNNADAQFCENCGAALHRNCLHCGEEVSLTAKFCDHCGKQL